MPPKRKREAFTAHEKLVHKSCALLQREAKKVRGFLTRKAVQQLKQLRQQLQEPADEHEKREKKLQAQIQRFEREHAALKTLDLKRLVARAREKTGLDKPQQEDEPQWEDEHSEEDSKEDSEQEETEEQETEEQETEKKDKQDVELEQRLMDRVLAHKQIVPLLDAIRTLVEKEEKENEKKRRAQEKRALKRGRHETLVGGTGRSAAPPSSLFLGSLSGRGGEDDLDMGMDSYGSMAGADDDIAEFLGEKKKKKNRPGQMARRMKAIRKEEALKRKEDRANGIFRPYKDLSASTSKYGPSERPKKAKPKAKSGSKQGDKKQPGDKNADKPAKSTPPRAASAPAAPMEAAHPSWLAKQKMKEKEKISMHAFSGKKITFGDD